MKMLIIGTEQHENKQKHSIICTGVIQLIRLASPAARTINYHFSALRVNMAI